jgi:uncharacterized protein with PIN domain
MMKTMAMNRVAESFGRLNMVEVAQSRCTGCNGNIFHVRNKTAENSWLFERLEQVGVELFIWGKKMNCPSCGKQLGAPSSEILEDSWERHGKVLSIEKDEPFDFLQSRESSL